MEDYWLLESEGKPLSIALQREGLHGELTNSNLTHHNMLFGCGTKVLAVQTRFSTPMWEQPQPLKVSQAEIEGCAWAAMTMQGVGWLSADELQDMHEQESNAMLQHGIAIALSLPRQCYSI